MFLIMNSESGIVHRWKRRSLKQDEYLSDKYFFFFLLFFFFLFFKNFKYFGRMTAFIFLYFI